MKEIQKIVDTEYQAIYRVIGGVLLVVNKFDFDEDYGEHCLVSPQETKPYNPLTQNLRILKEDYNHSEIIDYETRQSKSYVVPKGTVTSGWFPVKPTSRDNWTYIIKTTGECFGGDREEMKKHFSDIINILNNEV